MFINAVNDKLNGKNGTECLSNVGIPPKELQSTLALIVQVFIKPFSEPSSPVDGGTIGVKKTPLSGKKCFIITLNNFVLIGIDLSSEGSNGLKLCQQNTPYRITSHCSGLPFNLFSLLNFYIWM